jgi:hypothetical protein
MLRIHLQRDWHGFSADVLTCSEQKVTGVFEQDSCFRSFRGTVEFIRESGLRVGKSICQRIGDGGDPTEVHLNASVISRRMRLISISSLREAGPLLF